MPELTRWIRLGELAHTRSGDKGDRSNIGVVANDAAGYDWLETHLTPRPSRSSCVRWASDKSAATRSRGLHAFNFVVDHALAGGASRSLRLDTQGKALGVVLLEMKIPAPPDRPLTTLGGSRQIMSSIPRHPGRSGPGRRFSP